ncbi:MAG: 1-phosphofructokinase [Acetatifactor sp.]|nr:1-phosphofructokinase [Acetatifactor sp.]
MVYTVTFNPAIDYVAHVEDMRTGSINRLTSEEIYCGGKGINVSLVLRELGIPSRALGFVAGFTGKAIEEGVADSGVETDFVHLEKGCTRINVKIRSGQETDLNGRGPEIDDGAIMRLYEKLDRLQDGDMLVLAGSIPGGLPADIYENILAHLSGKKIRAVVDATGELLLNVLKYRPFLVKPNHHELGEMFGVALSDMDEIVNYARKLKELGAVNVLVSMAEDGAVLVDEFGEVHRCGACRGTEKNSVGAGDSMVAGFIAGSTDGDYEYALKLGTAAGGATAFSDGLAKREMISELLKQLL